MSKQTKQAKQIIPEYPVDKTVPFYPTTYRLLHVMRAANGEKLLDCVDRIVKDAYSRQQINGLGV